MPALRASDIVRTIDDAFADSSATALLVSESRAHPRRFYISAGEASFQVWIYIWTLTHGGGSARPQNEYRIQLTSVKPPLPENPDGPTLLLGYEPITNCFAGFDIRKHRQFSTQSPSVQISILALREAVRDGFAFARKGNDEIAVAFRPDNILAYCLNSESLHEAGVDPDVSALLSKAGRLEHVSEHELSSVPRDRRRIVTKVSRLARDSDFRRKVVVAYDRKCCVTGLQLKLIEAAHIFPVEAKGSIDDVRNGMCLSPTIHRAYDRGLIYLDEGRRMQINPKKKNELIRFGLSGGLHEFETNLGRQILLPADRKQWPKPEFIKAANNFRRAQGLL